MTDIDFVGYGRTSQLKGRRHTSLVSPRVRMYAPAKLLSTKSAISNLFITCTANPAQGKRRHSIWRFRRPHRLLGGTEHNISCNFFGTKQQLRRHGILCPNDKPEILSWINSFPNIGKPNILPFFVFANSPQRPRMENNLLAPLLCKPLQMRQPLF